MARTEVTGSQIKDGTVSLTADVTGILPVANGGTGSNTLTLNNVLLGNGTGALQAVAPGTSGQVLTSNGTTWSSAAISNVGLSQLSSTDLATVAQSLRSGYAISGGGTITVASGGEVSWTSRLIVINNGTGSNFSSDGYFEIVVPASGTTITGVGGASNRNVNSAGIPIGAWEALYYILPIGSGASSVAGNFRAVSFSSALNVPYNWVLICSKNNDDGVFSFAGGIKLGADQSITSAVQSTTNAASTLVRRDGSGGFSAGTVTVNNLVVGTAAAATNATSGFFYAPSCAGTPTGTPTSQTGTVPMIVDTTNSKIYSTSAQRGKA